VGEETRDRLSRRKFVGGTTAALAAAAMTSLGSAAQSQDQPQQPRNMGPAADAHKGANEKELVPQNPAAEQGEDDSVFPPGTDAGGQPPFKCPFAFARRRIEQGGWTRQVTVRDLPISKKVAGVEMRLIRGGIRELHWHVGAEWAYMTAGTARITCVDHKGRGFVEDVNQGDLWLFPGGFPHSIQGVGDDGCQFILVFNDGNFNEYQTFLLTEWMHHTPDSVLAKNFQAPESTFKNLPDRELFIFPRDLPRTIAEEKSEVEAANGPPPDSFAFFASKMQPTKVSAGGSVKIIDSHNFPATRMAAAIVTLQPGGLRELHWHPNEDEWQYYVSGQARMTVFAAGGHARTMDFHAGDVGYIEQSMPHYIENTGKEDCVFLEVFPTPEYQDISLAEWLAHTPSRLVNQHIGTGEEFIRAIPKNEIVVRPR